MKKYIFILLFLVLIAFKAGDNKSKYNVPLAAWSVTAGDIDLDGDNDIIIGHNYCSQTQWSGVSYLINSGDGTFFLNDSIYLYSWQTHIYAVNINSGPFPEIIARHYENETQYMAVLKYEQGNYVTNLYSMPFGISGDNIGDINGDGFIDIIVYSSDWNNRFWGVMYNDGTGNFSNPVYQYITDYFPRTLACGDLNGDNWDDIVVCGQSTEVYFSYSDGFQLLVLETDNYKEGVSIVDFDLDGDNDILTFVGIPFVNVTSLIMYENKGNNILDTLEEFYFQPMSSRFFVTDFNNDSLQDILFQLSDKSGYIIYYNQGDFQLADSQFVALPPSNPQEGWRNCYCADMDGNGYNDIITVKTLYVYLPDNLEILFNDGNGNFVEDPVTNIETPEPESPNPLSCYPNPFTTETTFQFTIKETALAELSVYDLQGRIITYLTKNAKKGENYKIKWDGFDEGGNPCKHGLYIAYLKVNGKICQSVKLIKLN
jgi:hypothetical protein